MTRKVTTLKTITILLFFCVLTFKVYASDTDFVPFHTFSADFQRETIENNDLLFTKGIIYFYLPYNVFIDVSEPLSQKMKIDSNQMVIYYPDENKGMIIKSNEPLSLPIVSPFFSATKSDFGLSLIGYSMKDYSIISDTITTKWTITNDDVENTYKFVVKSFNNSISEVLVYNTKSNKLIKRMIFSSYVLLNNEFLFPQELVIYDNEENEQIVETITLKSIQVDFKLPDSIINFKIPSNAETEEVQW